MHNISNSIDSAFMQYAQIINTYRINKAIDKKSISNQLGISLPTLYNAINKLKHIGILRETSIATIASKEKAGNRTENVIELVSDFAYCASFSIGASLCKFVLLDLDFEMMKLEDFRPHRVAIIKELKTCLKQQDLLMECDKKDKNYIYFKTPSTFLELKRAIDIVFKQLVKMMENASKAFHLLSIGITCTGMVNENEKVVRSANNLKYIENTALDNFFFPDKLNFFRERGVGIELIQNSNAAVIAEKVTLSKSLNNSVRNKKNIVAIYLGVGIGAGLYFDRLYSGASGYCGEIGHLPAPCYDIEKDFDEESHNTDEYCSCGKEDCYDYKIHKYVFNVPSREFIDFSSAKIRKHLVDNEDSAKILGKYLGSIVNLITTMLDVDVIVFTGKLYKSMDLLYNHIAEVQDESTIKFSRNDCMLMTSKYGPSAPAVGAAIYSYYKKYNLELTW